MQIVITLDVMLARRKMSVTELSEKCAMTLSNVSMIKTGKAKLIRFSTLNKICEILACKPCDIIDCVTDQEYNTLFRIREIQS